MRTGTGSWLLAGLLLFPGACSKKKPVPTITEPAVTILDQVRARSAPQTAQARFQIKVRSKLLGVGGTTGGGLQVVRPGKARLEVFGPFGGNLVSLIADGERFAAILPRENRHLLALDAEELVRDATRGAVGLDEVIGLLVGQVPFGAAELQELSVLREVGRIQASYEGPQRVSVVLDLDPEQFTPIRLVATDRDGEDLLRVRYDGWLELGEHLLPHKVELEVPSLDLFVGLRYASWQEPEALLSMDPLPAPGVLAEPLAEVLRQTVRALDQNGEAADAGGAPDEPPPTDSP